MVLIFGKVFGRSILTDIVTHTMHTVCTHTHTHAPTHVHTRHTCTHACKTRARPLIHTSTHAHKNTHRKTQPHAHNTTRTTIGTPTVPTNKHTYTQNPNPHSQHTPRAQLCADTRARPHAHRQRTTLVAAAVRREVPAGHGVGFDADDVPAGGGGHEQGRRPLRGAHAHHALPHPAQPPLCPLARRFAQDELKEWALVFDLAKLHIYILGIYLYFISILEYIYIYILGMGYCRIPRFPGPSGS